MKGKQAWRVIVAATFLGLVSAAGCRDDPVTPEQVLLGIWQQQASYTCDGAVIADPYPFRELEFRADGTFSLTWIPFDNYRDYWGTYSYDVMNGGLVLRITRGNHIPDGLDLEGAVEVRDDATTLLVGMYLGHAPPLPETVPETVPRACSYLIAR